MDDRVNYIYDNVKRLVNTEGFSVTSLGQLISLLQELKDIAAESQD